MNRFFITRPLAKDNGAKRSGDEFIDTTQQKKLAFFSNFNFPLCPRCSDSMQSDSLGPLLASSVRLIIGCKWPNFDLEPVSWRREDLSGKVLGRQQTVELLEVPSPNGVPCVIHACSFATPAEIEYLRRAVHFYKATANAGKADPILVTLAIDPEDALTALTQGIEVYLRRIDRNVTLLIAGGQVPRLNGALWETVSLDELAPPSTSGTRLAQMQGLAMQPPVPPPKTLENLPSSLSSSSKYDTAPLPSPIPGRTDIAKVSSEQLPPPPPPRDDLTSSTSSPYSSPLSGSRRGEALPRSMSYSPVIVGTKSRTDSNARLPDAVRRDTANNSPMKIPGRDDPGSNGTSPSRVGTLASAYDSDGGSARRDSEKEGDSDEEGGSKLAMDAKASPSDRRRHVVLEIVQTERDYVKDLELLLDGFHRPISKLAIVSPQDITAIFSNVSELLAINKEFLQTIEAKKDAAGADASLVCLGAEFKRSIEPFKRYSRFFSDYATSYSTVQKGIEQNVNLAAFLEENQANPRLRGLKLDQFLIKPVQRICKYPLLLKELAKATPPEHPDYADLQVACTEMNTLVAQLNEKKRTTETLQKVLELITIVEGLEKNPNFPRNVARSFIMEGELRLVSKKTTRYRVVLFSDTLFWLAIREKVGKDGRKVEFTGLAPLNATSRVVDIADNDEAKNVFSLQYAEGNVSFVCASAPEKRRWVREVRAQVNEHLKKDIKQKGSGILDSSRGSTPLRLVGSLRASSADVGRRDSNAEPSRVFSARGEETRKGSFTKDEAHSPASSPVPERRIPSSGSGVFASPGSARVPLGVRLREREREREREQSGGE